VTVATIAVETGVVIEVATEAAIVAADVADVGVAAAVAADPAQAHRNKIKAADAICLPPNMLRPRAIAIPAASIIAAARMIADPNVVQIGVQIEAQTGASNADQTELQLPTVDMTVALPPRRKREKTTSFFPANRWQNIARGPCLFQLSR
jgi:hypothetical protein